MFTQFLPPFNKKKDVNTYRVTEIHWFVDIIISKYEQCKILSSPVNVLFENFFKYKFDISKTQYMKTKATT